MGEIDKRRPTTAIARPMPDRVTVRGKDLCDELIGHESFSAYFLRLLGIEPEKPLVALVDATLVAISEHGLVPSIQAARMTLAAAPEALQGAVSAGLLGAGSVVLGASEAAGMFLDKVLQDANESKRPLDKVATEALGALRADRRPLPGFGHPLHKPEDPRAWRLLELANELGTAGEHVEALLAVHKAVPQVYGKHLALNVSGAIPAVLLDAGFPVRGLKGIPLIARTASLIAHLLEEQDNPIGFALSNAGDRSVDYSGALSAKDLETEGGQA